jgi:asparagine synthase (glutamine-hydrolysing)
LRIFGIKGGHQPLTNEDGTVWAVLGGEIDNHLGLRERLLAPRATFRLKVDTEVLVHLYEE